MCSSFRTLLSQTKTLKLEKEAQKSKARKSRDAFLLMLAENTGIDVRTTWRSAVLLLQDDVRYKNVDDSNDREDLFNDFVSELEKKEKEDRSKHRDAALKHLQTLYEELLEKGA
jgi:pre-mRNA-processing factor 40